MLEKLSGIFAFAIWDREKQELFVARDGFGVKPLYYARLPCGGVAFASELKALIYVPGVGAGLDFKALSDYLTYLWSPGERTLLRDVRKLPPGHFFKADRASFLITRWHEQAKSPVATTAPASTRETISRLGELVDEVVGDQCLSDVPIGALPMLRRPYAVWMLGIDVWSPRMLGDYGRRIEEASLLLSISDFTRRRAVEFLPSAQRAKVCWLATEEDDVPEASGDFGGPPTVLILGRVDASEMRKGHFELIDCWSSVMAAIPDARLLIAGGGDGLGILRARAGASAAASNIEFTGFLPQSEIDALWSRAHVFAMPSRQEGFGLVYIEAMRRGVPVIASTQDAGQEINLHGVTGYNVDLEREGELARRTIELLSNKVLARQFGENGREHWRANFCFSAFRRRMEPILTEFLGA